MQGKTANIWRLVRRNANSRGPSRTTARIGGRSETSDNATAFVRLRLLVLVNRGLNGADIDGEQIEVARRL
jgi:hypothetical protein